MIQDLFCAVLRRTNHTVYTASNGMEGIELIKRAKPDLIVTDISMPGMDGYQMADRIGADPTLASIPIIYMSAFTQASDKERAYQHRASAFISKPIKSKDLLTVIESVLRKTGACHENSHLAHENGY